MCQVGHDTQGPLEIMVCRETIGRDDSGQACGAGCLQAVGRILEGHTGLGRQAHVAQHLQVD
ncbi:hypothetical protein RZS08_62405, partial [Arthrospira platensis SPKY1]|nr:hypothetical protein [Arthrospira platensis SPKY1]